MKDENGVYVAGEDNKVVMKDDTTKIQFLKFADDSGELLGGAVIAVYDSEGNEVERFTTSGGEKTQLEKLLIVGETYTFKELEAPSGYKKASPVTLTVEDTGEWQSVQMTDRQIERIGNNSTPEDGSSPDGVPKAQIEADDTDAPQAPETGDHTRFAEMFFLMTGALAGMMHLRRKKRFYE